jgi:hypothetical protein
VPAARSAGIFGRVVAALGRLASAADLPTVLLPLGETASTVFGFGRIAWFVAIEARMMRSVAVTDRLNAPE